LTGATDGATRREGGAEMSDRMQMNEANEAGQTFTGHWPSGQQDVLALAAISSRLRGVRKGQLQPGDTLLVKTKNSFYAIGIVDDGAYAVTGGWFSENGASRASVTINGCTWGGQAIMTDMLAAPGLFLEFGNGVRTTRILAVTLVTRRQNAFAN
jgi:hypothetical protein